MHEPQELSYATCRGLLAIGVVGRAAVTTPDGPRIFTVNYSVVDEAILFRTTPDSVLGTYARNSALAFQVDNLDYEQQRAWSVMATGRAQAVEDPHEIAHIRAVWEPRPWAAGERELYVRLAWDELSGRQLGLSSDPKSELPVRRTV
jgi:nitroimidazol reductase NimA-like FMN-containing flavoprotein (pyridoxamine 5'-phosphate oxidase superfamily)